MCTKKQPDKSLRPRVYIVPAVTTTKHIGNAPNPHGREPPKEQSSLFPATLREGGASLREATSLASPSRQQVAAALSAAVTYTKLIGNAPNPHGDVCLEEKTSLFPATLREGARGRGFS